MREEELNCLYVINKIDGQEQQKLVWDFQQMGLPFLTISAAHNACSACLPVIFLF